MTVVWSAAGDIAALAFRCWHPEGIQRSGERVAKNLRTQDLVINVTCQLAWNTTYEADLFALAGSSGQVAGDRILHSRAANTQVMLDFIEACQSFQAGQSFQAEVAGRAMPAGAIPAHLQVYLGSELINGCWRLSFPTSVELAQGDTETVSTVSMLRAVLGRMLAKIHSSRMDEDRKTFNENRKYLRKCARLAGLGEAWEKSTPFRVNGAGGNADGKARERETAWKAIRARGQKAWDARRPLDVAALIEQCAAVEGELPMPDTRLGSLLSTLERPEGWT